MNSKTVRKENRMPENTRILSVGHDHHLLSMRSMVLEAAGFDVIEAYAVSDALRLAQSDAVDLVLLCHTVPKSEQIRLVSAIRERRRLMPVLCVIAHDVVMPAEGCLSANSAPQQLLDALHQAAFNYSNFRPNLAA
jgi:DNA-binding NtrC family response regulator